MLGEYLEENCPDVSVQVVVKSNEDWGEYIDSVSRIRMPIIDLLTVTLLNGVLVWLGL